MRQFGSVADELLPRASMSTPARSFSSGAVMRNKISQPRVLRPGTCLIRVQVQQRQPRKPKISSCMPSEGKLCLLDTRETRRPSEASFGCGDGKKSNASIVVLGPPVSFPGLPRR